MDLVSSIKQSSRGAGKGMAWNVQLNMPALVGNISARDVGMVAATEIIAAIRDKWKRGQRVDGRQRELSEDTRMRRKAERYVLLTNPDFEDYHEYVSTQIDPHVQGQGWKAQVATRRRKILRIGFDKFDAWKQRIEKRYMGDPPDGEIGKRRSHRYEPKASNPAINGSGLMLEGLRGKYRNARTARMRGKPVVIQQNIELRLPKSRQRQGAWIGGLTQAAHDGMTRTFREMPQTKAMLRDSIKWQRVGEVSASVLRIALLLNSIRRLL